MATIVQLTLFPVVSQADQWWPTTPTDQSQVIIGVSDVQNVVALSDIEGLINNGLASESLCSGYQSTGDCQYGAPGETAAANIVLPVCTSPSQTDCIVSVSVGSSAAALQPATFIRQTQGASVTADPTYGLPAGSTIGLWSSTVPSGGGTTTYAASVSLNYLFSGGHFVPRFMAASIQPYSVISGSQFSTPSVFEVTDPTTGRLLVAWSATPQSCAWEESGLCGVRQDLSPGTVASMTIRLTNQVGGWFFGRMQNPTMSVSKFDSATNVLTVTAGSVQVPELELTSPYPNIAPDFQKFIAGLSPPRQPSGGFYLVSGPTLGSAFSAIGDLRSDATDTSTAVVNVWSFNSIGLSAGNSCMADTSLIDGMVTTNAMAYSGAVPTFNNGYLSYQVAGMHYLPGGSLTPGSYDLIMADSVARCLYNFSNAPISATVSITNDSSGNQNVATTNVTDINGWLHVSALGFTFSDPIIQVHLTEQAVSKPPVTKVSIVCVSIKNPRLKKRIVGVHPRCPAGYKRR